LYAKNNRKFGLGQGYTNSVHCTVVVRSTMYTILQYIKIPTRIQDRMATLINILTRLGPLL
jgi:hypothetical protein